MPQRMKTEEEYLQSLARQRDALRNVLGNQNYVDEYKPYIDEENANIKNEKESLKDLLSKISEKEGRNRVQMAMNDFLSASTGGTYKANPKLTDNPASEENIKLKTLLDSVDRSDSNIQSMRRDAAMNRIKSGDIDRQIMAGFTADQFKNMNKPREDDPLDLYRGKKIIDKEFGVDKPKKPIGKPPQYEDQETGETKVESWDPESGSYVRTDNDKIIKSYKASVDEKKSYDYASRMKKAHDIINKYTKEGVLIPPQALSEKANKAIYDPSFSFSDTARRLQLEYYGLKDKKQIELLKAITDYVAARASKTSGAEVKDSEYEKYKMSIPTVEDPPKEIEFKSQLRKSEMDDYLNASGFYGVNMQKKDKTKYQQDIGGIPSVDKKEEKLIPMIAPDGSRIKIPESLYQKALDKGAKDAR